MMVTLCCLFRSNTEPIVFLIELFTKMCVICQVLHDVMRRIGVPHCLTKASIFYNIRDRIEETLDSSNCMKAIRKCLRPCPSLPVVK